MPIIASIQILRALAAIGVVLSHFQYDLSRTTGLPDQYPALRLGNAGVLPAVSLHVYGVESGRIGTHVNRKVDVA